MSIDDSGLESVEKIIFHGAGVELAADVAGPPEGQPVIFLHGSGQTRRSWRKAVQEAAIRGYRAIAIDLRGHGESDWSADGRYDLNVYVADLSKVVEQIGGRPAVVGASTGGLVSMATAALPSQSIRAVVAVDISPSPNMEGVQEVRAFMNSAQHGFASLEEAADAVAAYLPQRARPRDTNGLSRNLRLRDGRYHWHWDPKFFLQMAGEPGHVGRAVALMKRAAATLTVPILLVRGGSSRVVTESGAREFLAMVPHAEFADIAGADHMVAGDANDAFNQAAFSFLDRQMASSQPRADRAAE